MTVAAPEMEKRAGRIQESDLIVAPATPWGESAVAIVRLSGLGSAHHAETFVEGSTPISQMAPRTMNLARLREEREMIDQVVVVRFANGASYTGEEMVEIHTHGNPLIVQRVIDLAVKSGARVADPGEFTRRAFLNGRIDLTQAEAVADLIQGESRAALRAAANQLRGDLRRRLGDLRQRIVDLLARLELELDFVEEGYQFTGDEEVKEALVAVDDFVDGLLDSWRSLDAIRTGPRVLLLGRPNAGKSSLFNALLGYGRAIVSDTPGTTRDYIEERVMLEGEIVRLVDSAGIRSAVEAIERVGVEMSEELIATADVLLYLADVSPYGGGLAEDDLELFGRVRRNSNGTQVLLVGTKIDRVTGELSEEIDVGVSIHQRNSISRLIKAIVERRREAGESHDIMVNARQAAELKSVQVVVKVILSEFDGLRGETELLSARIRELLAPLSRLTGETTNEDVLDAVFSRFCIGK